MYNCHPRISVFYSNIFLDIWHWDLEIRRLNKLRDKETKMRQIEIKSVERILYRLRCDYIFEQNPASRLNPNYKR